MLSHLGRGPSVSKELSLQVGLMLSYRLGLATVIAGDKSLRDTPYKDLLYKMQTHQQCPKMY